MARLLVLPYCGSASDTSPLPSSGVSVLAESVGLTVALALATCGTHTLTLTSPSIPVLSHTEPHTGVPSCLLREEQTLTCEAEFTLKIVIVPQGMNPTLFFHFPAVLLFFSSCLSLSVSLPQRGQPFTPQFPATWCAL